MINLKEIIKLDFGKRKLGGEKKAIVDKLVDIGKELESTLNEKQMKLYFEIDMLRGEYLISEEDELIDYIIELYQTILVKKWHGYTKIAKKGVILSVSTEGWLLQEGGCKFAQPKCAIAPFLFIAKISNYINVIVKWKCLGYN